MKNVNVFLLFALAAGAQVSPLAKVYELIHNLHESIIADGEKEQQAYKKLYDYCGHSSNNLQFEIETATNLKDKLSAKISKLSSDIEVGETEIGEHVSSISKDEGELKEATAIRDKEHEEFKIGEKELITTVDTLERALSTLEKELSKGKSFAQIDTSSLMTVVQTLSVLGDAAAMDSESMDTLTSLIQAHDEDGDIGAPSAAAYKKQSGSIMDVLEDMRDKAEHQLAEIRKDESNKKNSFELLRQGLQDEVKATEKEKATTQSESAVDAEEKASAESNLAIAKKELASSQKKKEELLSSCQVSAADHQANVAAREQELKVIEQAKKVLKESTGGSGGEEESEDSFLQMRSHSTSSMKLQMRIASSAVIAMVQELAKTHHSASLAQLASRISTEFRYASKRRSSDPFKKVRDLIVGMIKHLEKSQAADATEKAYCDEEMSKTKAKHEELQDSLEKLAAKIGMAASKSAALKEECTELSGELASLAKEQANMDAIRREDTAAHAAAKKDLEQGLGGVRKALSVLRDFYGNEDKGESLLQDADEDQDSGRDEMSSLMQQGRQPAPPQKFEKQSGAGQGIIGILEVCESDLAKNLATEDAEESDAQANYEKATQRNKITKAEKEQDLKFQTKEFKSLDKSISEMESDKTTVVEEFSAVSDYWTKVKERCVAKPVSYDELKARRDAEVQGLREALASLENVALTQISKHRRLHR